MHTWRLEASDRGQVRQEELSVSPASLRLAIRHIQRVRAASSFGGDRIVVRSAVGEEGSSHTCSGRLLWLRASMMPCWFRWRGCPRCRCFTRRGTWGAWPKPPASQARASALRLPTPKTCTPPNLPTSRASQAVTLLALLARWPPSAALPCDTPSPTLYPLRSMPFAVNTPSPSSSRGGH